MKYRIHKPVLSWLAAISLLLSSTATLQADEPLRGALYRNGNSRTGVHKCAGVPKMNKVAWKFQAKGGIYSSPVVLDGVLYIGSRDGNVYALNAADGSVKWSFAIKGGSDCSACVINDTVFIGGNDGFLYALKTATGEQVWKTKVRSHQEFSPVLSSPAYAYGTVFVIPAGHILGYDAKTGKEVYKTPTSIPSGKGEMAPTLTADTVIRNHYTSGGIVVFSLKSGEVLGTSTSHGAGAATTVALADGVTYSTQAGYYCIGALGNPKIVAAPLNPPKGRELGSCTWMEPAEPHVSAKEESALWSSPAVWNGRIFFGCDSGYFGAYDTKNGKPLWGYKEIKAPVRSSPSVSAEDGVVYFSADDGHLYAMKGETGALLWKHRIETQAPNVEEMKSMLIRSSPWIESGTVYIGSADGNVWAIQ